MGTLIIKGSLTNLAKDPNLPILGPSPPNP